MSWSRREFMSGVALGALGSTGLSATAGTSPVTPTQKMRAAGRPVIVSAGNGYSYLEDRKSTRLNSSH